MIRTFGGLCVLSSVIFASASMAVDGCMQQLFVLAVGAAMFAVGDVALLVDAFREEARQ